MPDLVVLVLSECQQFVMCFKMYVGDSLVIEGMLFFIIL